MITKEDIVEYFNKYPDEEFHYKDVFNLDDPSEEDRLDQMNDMIYSVRTELNLNFDCWTRINISNEDEEMSVQVYWTLWK